MKSEKTSNKLLKYSFAVSEDIMARASKSFYYAFKNLPSERFAGVTAIYAFCRYVDDLVDDNIESKDPSKIISTLNTIEEAVKQIYSPHTEISDEAKSVKKKEWWPAFEITVDSFNIPIKPFLDQIKGQRMDVHHFEIKTIEDLIQYSDYVAGSVGAMLLPLLLRQPENANNEHLLTASRGLGIGMQVSNILRDIGEDIRERDRIYIPNVLLKEFDVSEELLVELSHYSGEDVVSHIPQSFIDLWENLSQLSEDYYNNFYNWVSYFHPSCQVPLVTAALIYGGIEDAVRKEKYNCLTQRCATSSLSKVLLTNKAKSLVKRKKAHQNNEEIIK